ncbi:MAG: hypothetical protein QXU75_08450 [Candidatus Methanomethylicaceae archaeon]
MATAENSLLGFAAQSAIGSEVTTDASFDYLYFTDGAMGVNNINLPLDPEIGGGAMLRNIVRAGVSTAGQITFIPRPKTLAKIASGVLGSATINNYGVNWDAFGSGWITSSQTYNATLATANPVEVLVVKTGASNIVISGEDESSQAINYTIAPASGPGRYTSTQTFKKITGVTVPSGAKLKLGIRETGAKTYVAKLDQSDQFSIPYHTVRFLPGKLWKETYVDTRFVALGLEWAASQFMRGTLAMLGRQPKFANDTSLTASPDNGSPFVGVSGYVEFGGTSLKTIGGNFAVQNQVSMDEEYVIGSYYPETLSIVSRTAAINFIVKIDDADLYKKMMYNPSASNEWSEQIMRDGNFVFSLASEPRASSTSPFSSGAPSDYQALRNRIMIYADMDAQKMAWTATPIGLRAQRQITMQMSGLFLADVDPITIEVVAVD